MAHLKKPRLLLFITLLLAFITYSLAHAQEALRVHIGFIDNAKFPNLEIYVSVKDSQGLPITGLKPVDFSISEDEKPVSNFEILPIQHADQPLAIVIAIDTTVSMSGSSNSLQDVIRASSIFIEALPPQDQIAIVGFSDKTYVVQEFTTDKDLLKKGLTTLISTNQITYDGSRMYDALMESVNLLKNRSEQKDIILITNGLDSGSGNFDFRTVVDESIQLAIPIYPIGFGDSIDIDKLTTLANLTGGTLQISKVSSGVTSSLEKISQIMREQYLIRYSSALPADSNQHTLKVSVRDGSYDERFFTATIHTIGIAINFPDGQVVSDDILLKPEIHSITPIAKVEILLDDKSIQVLDSEPFEYMLKTGTIMPGAHKVTFIVTDKIGNVEQKSFTLNIQSIPNLTQTPNAIFDAIDQQLKNALKGNIAFNKPEHMEKDATATIELILSPSKSESELATQLANQGGFATSTAEPNVLIAPNGEKVTIATSQIEITPRMKATLLSQDPDAFTITAMHDNDEQVISTIETTTWRWSVTARKEGQQALELIIYQLVKYDGKEFWHEVETYKANIIVDVTVASWIKSLDWKWMAGFLLALVGSILGILNWLNNRNKEEKSEKNKPVKSVKKVKK